MSEPKFRNDADHCDRMAAIVLSKAQRESYQELAAMWRKLADEVCNHRQRVDAWTRRAERAPPAMAFAEADGATAPGAG